MEFITQLEEADAEQFQDDFGKFIRGIDEYMNTDALGGQFGKAVVYDNTKLNLANISRSPGSRVKGNARDERGKGRKGNIRDAHLTNWGDPNWEAGNHQIQEGSGENGDYHGNLEGRPMDVLFAGNENGPSVDLDWGDWETMGPIVSRRSILKITRELEITKNCKTKRMLGAYKVFAKETNLRGGEVNFRAPLNNSKTK